MLTRRSSGRYGRTRFITAGYPERGYCIRGPSYGACRRLVIGVPGEFEILSESFRKLPLTEMAQKSFEATMEQFPQ